MNIKKQKANFMHSLTGKITIYFTFGFAALWIVCNSLLFYEFKDTLWSNFDQQMLSQAKRVAEDSSYNPKIVPLPQSNENYIVVYESESGYIDSLFAPPADIQESILNSRNATYRSDNENDGVIEVIYSQSAEEVEASIHRLDIIYYVSLVLGILLAFLLSFWVAKKILKPINQLIEVADSTDLKKNPELLETTKSQDELGQLIISFNRMLLRIREQSDLQNTFFASASHELRTPLSIMQGQLQVLIQSEEASAEEQTVYMQQLTEVKRLIRTVNDFLLMSELLNNKTNISDQEIDLVDLLSSILSSYQTKAVDRKLKFKLSFEPIDASFNITSDYDKFYTILSNLIGNAIKYSKENTSILILVKSDLQAIEIKIENIVENTMSDISSFKKSFYHSKPLQGEGSGLGLWIVNQLCQLLHYHFEISQSDSTFSAIINCKPSKDSSNE